MHLFLIRHGETEHNVAGLLAGVTDSRLTNHGVTQTQRLGSNLAKDRCLRFTNVYSSDLQRAFMTANEICKAQNLIQSPASKIEVVKLPLLREVDFGSLELVAWSSRRVEEPSDDEHFKPKETADAMQSRANTFLDDYIVPLLAFDHEEETRVAIVSHGIFLGHLWRTLLSKFGPKTVTLDPNVPSASSGQTLERMSWSNTGCLEVDIHVASPGDFEKDVPTTEACDTPSSTPFAKATMKVQSINDKRHLLNLKRARGGIGSAAHDQRQQNLNTFFRSKKLKTAPSPVKAKSLIPAVLPITPTVEGPTDAKPAATQTSSSTEVQKPSQTKIIPR